MLSSLVKLFGLSTTVRQKYMALLFLRLPRKPLFIHIPIKLKKAHLGKHGLSRADTLLR
jgi:hypothetical protein